MAGFLARKRLAWETRLDVPVDVSTPCVAGTSMAAQILLREPGTEQGWLVFLGITNPGHMLVPSGTLAAHAPRIRQEGTLASGKIITGTN